MITSSNKRTAVRNPSHKLHSSHERKRATTTMEELRTQPSFPVNHAPDLRDLLLNMDKGVIVFWFECIVLAYGTWSFLAPRKFRRAAGLKPGWNETDPKIPMVAFDWFARRSSLCLVTHALYWILYDAVGLQPTAVVALTALPWTMLCLHAILNDIPQQMEMSALCDVQIFVMMGATNLLLYLDSPYLLPLEKICNVFSVVTALQLYLAPRHITWIYNMPRHFAEQTVMAHHMNYFGHCILIMTVMEAPLVWQDEQVDRDVVLQGLALSLLVDVFGYIPLIKDAKEFVGNMGQMYVWMAASLCLALVILFL